MTDPSQAPDDPSDATPQQNHGGEPTITEWLRSSQDWLGSSPSGLSPTATATLWTSATTAREATRLAERDTPDKDIKMKELELARASSDQSHKRFMAVLDYDTMAFKSGNLKEWAIIGLAAIVVLVGIFARLYLQEDLGIGLIVGGAFTLLGYYAGRVAPKRG